jgi:hypothetical protein
MNQKDDWKTPRSKLANVNVVPSNIKTNDLEDDKLLSVAQISVLIETNNTIYGVKSPPFWPRKGLCGD